MAANPQDAIDSAEDALRKARVHQEAGDEDHALKLLNISLRIHKLDAAEELKSWIEKYGSRSENERRAQEILAAADHYAVFELPRFSPLTEPGYLHRTYLKMTRHLHPDKNKAKSANAAFQRLGEAKRILSDELLKQNYDVRLQNELWAAQRKQEEERAQQQVNQMAQMNGYVASLRVDVLKMVCKRLKEASSGAKAELVFRVQQYYNMFAAKDGLAAAFAALRDTVEVKVPQDAALQSLASAERTRWQHLPELRAALSGDARARRRARGDRA